MTVDLARIRLALSENWQNSARIQHVIECKMNIRMWWQQERSAESVQPNFAVEFGVCFLVMRRRSTESGCCVEFTIK